MKFIINIFRWILGKVLDIPANQYHPLVWISGKPTIGENVYIGGFSEVNAKGAVVKIGDNCDIASFVVINCNDSHLKTIGLSPTIERKDIIIEENVFIGTQATILGGTFIGNHSVISSGTVLKDIMIPPYSLVVGGQIKSHYYETWHKTRRETVN